MSLGSFQIVLTTAQYQALATRMAQMGFDTSALSGTLPETSGVVLGYAVAPGDLSTIVTFTVQRKPFFASVGMIESKVKEEMGVS
jgi:hypothetical protein